MTGLGTIINAAAILVGGVLGLATRDTVISRYQHSIKMLLAGLTVYAGGSMIWGGLDGPLSHALGQIGIAMLALILGNIVGKTCGIQSRLNGLGQWAQERFSGGNSQHNWSEGFVTTTLLFCVGPMALLGAIEDGLHGNFRILAIKGAMDGLATMGFVAVFGRGVLLSVLPVVVYQGTVTLLAGMLGTEIREPLASSIGVTGGFIVLMIPVVILEVRRAPLADYLPALAVAPLLTAWWM